MPELLEDDIRATAPLPSDEFVSRLERRVETGFAAPPKPAKAPKPRWRLRPALALVVVVGTVGIFSATAILMSVDDMSSTQTFSDAAPRSAEDSAASGGATSEAAPQAIAPVEPRKRLVAPGSEPRKREVDTTLALTTPADEFGETTAGVLRIADQTGTIVQSSNVTQRDGTDRATYDLRVPTSQLAATVRDLSELGDVTSRDESVQDITQAFVSARDRLEDARDVRAALLKALERADSEGERSAIRARLRDARVAISAAEASVRRVRARSDRATVTVNVTSTSEKGAWTPADAWDDALRVLEVVAGVVLVALAILLPLGILVIAGTWASRLTRRRRRDAVLG